MSLDQFLAEADGLVKEASGAFESARDAEALEAARIEFLGAAKGRLKAIQKQLGAVAKEDKPAAGKRFNEAKTQIEGAFEAAQERLKGGGGASGEASQFDPTLPGKPLRLGRLHPITQTIEELKDIMGRLGFSPADGPEIEDEWHNFEALNIPLEHPARDPLDNFYLAVAGKQALAPNSQKPKATEPVSGHRSLTSALLLRSQTSTVQIRVMKSQSPPVRIIVPGRVFRRDNADATHNPTFQQIEGLYVDKGVTVGDLKGTVEFVFKEVLGDDVKPVSYTHLTLPTTPYV